MTVRRFHGGAVCALAAALVGGGLGAARAADAPKIALTAKSPAPSIPSPQDFVSQISAGDAFEIAAAQLAEQRAQTPAVRQFAAQMAKDHTASGGELKTAVSRSGQRLSLATGPATDEQRQLEALRAIEAKGFDKAYMDGQVQAHQTALDQLQTYAQNGEVPALKTFATQATDGVQHHLLAAKDLVRQMP